MKKINKIFLLCTLLLSLFLLSCGKQTVEAEALDPSTSAELEQTIEQYFTSMVTQDESSLNQGIQEAYKAKEEVLYNALNNFKNDKEELGEFQEVKENIVTKENGEYKFHLVAQFEKRKLDFDASLKEDYSEFTSMSFVPEYSMEEKMASAGQNLLVGMGMVFAVLIFIAWIISLFKYIHIWEEKHQEKKAKRKMPAPTAKAVEKQVPKRVVPLIEKEEGIPEDVLSIVMMAAIEAYEAEQVVENPFKDAKELNNGLVVRSIRRRR